MLHGFAKGNIPPLNYIFLDQFSSTPRFLSLEFSGFLLEHAAVRVVVLIGRISRFEKSSNKDIKHQTYFGGKTFGKSIVMQEVHHIILSYSMRMWYHFGR